MFPHRRRLCCLTYLCAHTLTATCVSCAHTNFDLLQANLGVAQLLVRALQQRCLSAAAARSRIWMVDSKGLITSDRPNLTPQKAEFAQDAARLTKAWRVSGSSSGGGNNGSSSSSSRRRPSTVEVVQQLTSIVEAVQPTALIGAAAVPDAFCQPVLQALLKVGEWWLSQRLCVVARACVTTRCRKLRAGTARR